MTGRVAEYECVGMTEIRKERHEVGKIKKNEHFNKAQDTIFIMMKNDI